VADNLTPEQRRRTMQAVKGRNTSLEKTVAAAFWRKGWRYRRNYTSLPGKPDFVFTKSRVAVFVDGDFWHGWRYPLSALEAQAFRLLAEKDRTEPAARPIYNFRCLRRLGWKVIRIWGHEVERDLAGAVERVKALLDASHTRDGNTRHAADGEGDLRRRLELSA